MGGVNGRSQDMASAGRAKVCTNPFALKIYSLRFRDWQITRDSARGQYINTTWAISRKNCSLYTFE